MNQTRTLSMYLALSFFAAILLTLLVLMIPPQTFSLSFLDKVWIATVFILCCIIGISFTIHPNWIRRYFPKIKNEEKNTRSSKERSFRGHHPDCLTYQNHTIQWNRKVWCAGCLGLLMGLCVSIVLMLLYILADFQLTKMTSVLLLVLGLSIVPVLYIEILYRSRYAIVHVFINSLMPVCFFIITIAVGEITGEFIYGLFSILLCFLWLDTRIQLSKSHHRSLCRNCVESCKMFTVSI